MAINVTFKPDGSEFRAPGDNVTSKDWFIKVDGEVIGSISS
ncbi:hypothetical protein NUH87_00890 [Pseudomonas batumici]